VRGLASLLLALVLAPVLVACGEAPAREVIDLGGRTMGTTWSLRLAAPPEDLDVDALARDVEARLAAVNARMSTWDPDSELSRFNAADPGAWFEVSAPLVEVVSAARTLSERTDGAFDVTVGPLVDLWGFGPGESVAEDALPDDAAIAAARARTGWQRLEVRADPPALRRAEEVTVDLSAIAKGHGVDAMGAVVEAAGVTDYLAEIGGELRARGRNGRGVPWVIGIEVPDPARRGVAREALGLDDAAVATSGDYRNFFTVDEARYSHTIDPATGRPVSHDVASVTVVHDSAMWADGWATALNVLGAERGLAVAETQGLAVLFILYTDDGLAERASAEFEALRARSTP
jgi:thiamine biosynthesis lipoprotein